MTRKTKGRASFHQATQNTTDSQNLTAPAHRITMIAAIKRRLWLMGYELEGLRQFHAASGHFWEQAGICITLALLRFWRLI